MTLSEYLASERNAGYWHEYDNGVIQARARSNRNHCLITGNLGAEIDAQVRQLRLETYIASMRVYVETAGLCAYPDVVVCHDPRFLDQENDTLLNPTVLIEVSSPATEAYDRGRKFQLYQRLESLREYVLVAQDQPRVERYVRSRDEWNLTRLKRIEDVLQLSSIDCQVSLQRVYERIAFTHNE